MVGAYLGVPTTLRVGVKSLTPYSWVQKIEEFVCFTL